MTFVQLLQATGLLNALLGHMLWPYLLACLQSHLLGLEPTDEPGPKFTSLYVWAVEGPSPKTCPHVQKQQDIDVG